MERATGFLDTILIDKWLGPCPLVGVDKKCCVIKAFL
jgi:hypothetical protein